MALYAYAKVNFDTAVRVYEGTKVEISLKNALVYFEEKIKQNDLSSEKITFDANNCDVDGKVVKANGSEAEYAALKMPHAPNDYIVSLTCAYKAEQKRTDLKNAKYIVNVSDNGTVLRYKKFY